MQSRTTPNGICLSVAEESSVCLVCADSVTVSASLNIFYTSMPRNGESLANFVLGILRLCSSELTSSHICLQCYELFRTLEQAQWTAHHVKCQIFQVFRSKSCDASKILDGESQIANPVNNDQKAFGVESQASILTDDVQKALDEPSQSSILLNYSQNVLDDRFQAIPVNGGEKTIDEELQASIPVNGSEKTVKQESHPSIFTRQSQDILPNDSFPENAKPESSEEEICAQNILLLRENKKINCSHDYVKIHEPSSRIDATYDGEADSRIDSDNSSQKFNHRRSHDDYPKNSNSVFSPGQPNDSKSIEPLDGARKSIRNSKSSQKSLEYNCATCNKKWRSAAELKTHIKSHSNLRPYMCEKCGQAYKHKHALEIHIGMHNGISPFKCNVCEKLFTQKGALMRHLPMHTGETPYQCELCGKRFVHHTSYNMHALSHTGKKSYQCHVCDLSLLSTSHLKRHMRVHTGEKPYKCSLCGKSFAERYNLFAHQKIHDPVEIMAKAAKKVPFKCQHCDEQFDKKKQFEEHKIQHEKAETLANEKKWIGHTIDVDPTTNNVQEFTNLRDSNHLEQSWRNINYDKFASPQIEFKMQEDRMTEESFDILMAQGNHKLFNSSSTTDHIAIVDQPQI